MFQKTTNKPRRLFHVLMAFSVLFLSVLACDEPEREFDRSVLIDKNLTGQDLSNLNLGRFDFSEKIMQSVDLQGSEIIEANFTNTDLRNADLSDAIAYDAIFSGTDLRGANLDRLCFKGATWDGATLDPHWQEIVALLNDGGIYAKALRDLDLSGICLKDYDLENLDFSNVNLSNAQLARTNLTQTNLQHVNFTRALLGNTFLIGANLRFAIITEEQLARAVLCRTTLPDGKISNRDCDLSTSAP